MGNDAKFEQELAVKHIKPTQVAPLDENHDGKVSAQEARDFLVKQHVPLEQVNNMSAQALGDKVAAAVTPPPQAKVQTPVHPKPSTPVPHANMTPEMQRALHAAVSSGLSTSIHYDTQNHGQAQVPAGLHHAPQRAASTATR
jgi:hypothetical protein